MLIRSFAYYEDRIILFFLAHVAIIVFLDVISSQWYSHAQNENDYVMRLSWVIRGLNNDKRWFRSSLLSTDNCH